MRFLLIALVAAACSACSAGPQARVWKPEGSPALKFRRVVPAKIEPGKLYPLVVFLHGSGERGDDNEKQLIHGVRPLLQVAESIGEPCYLIAPQCPADQWWVPIDRDTMHPLDAGGPNPMLDSLLGLVRKNLRERPIDPKRVYVTGLSMGGYGTWELLTRSPGMWACGVPVCGGGDPKLAGRFKNVPVWAFHGESDPAVPATTTRDMIKALRNVGGNPKVTIYPGVGHDSWTRTYSQQAVIRWMFDQKRP